MATKIYIDQGHNPQNPNAGAEGNGYREQDLVYAVGIALAERLRTLGAHVTVAARKSRDVARIQCAHCRAIHLTGEESLTPLTAGYAVVFNTIPYHVLTPRLLSAMPRKTLLMELASAPGGWDAKSPIPCRTVYAPGLPGKYAPRTAGVIVADTLLPMLEEVTEV